MGDAFASSPDAKILECVVAVVVVVDNGSMTTKQQNRTTRDTVSARIDPAVLEVVERVAEAERRPVSNLVRNILADWARARQPQQRASA